MKVPYILWVVAKSQGVWGCESKGIKGVYRSSKHRVGGNQTVWNNHYMGKQGWGLMENQWWVLASSWAGCMSRCPSRVGPSPEHWSRMDAKVPQSVIDGSWLVFGLGLMGLSELSVDKMRWLEEHKGLQWTVGIDSGFIGVDMEVNRGIVVMILSLLVLEVTRIIQSELPKGCYGT